MKKLIQYIIILLTYIGYSQAPLADELVNIHSVTNAQMTGLTTTIGSIIYNSTNKAVYAYTIDGWEIINDNSVDLDIDPTNELYDDTVIQAEVDSNTSGVSDNANDIADHIASDNDTSITNEIQIIESTDGSVSITQTGNDYDISVPSITETVTTFMQDDSSNSGEITYTDENGTDFTAQVIGIEGDNQIEVGTNGGAYLGPMVYTGTFIISAEGTTTVTGIPFQPSQVTFMANANVESLNIDEDNGTGNNDRGIDNTHGTMNGFVRNIGGTLVQQAMFVGGHGNSINDISRYASSSNCIGIRYGDQNGSSLGKIEGAFGAFTADGFTINVTYTDGVITVNNGNPLVDVQPDDINNEALLVIFTAYK